MLLAPGARKLRNPSVMGADHLSGASTVPGERMRGQFSAVVSLLGGRGARRSKTRCTTRAGRSEYDWIELIPSAQAGPIREPPTTG